MGKIIERVREREQIAAANRYEALRDKTIQDYYESCAARTTPETWRLSDFAPYLLALALFTAAFLFGWLRK